MVHIHSLRTVLPIIEVELGQAQQYLEYLHITRDSENLEQLIKSLDLCVGGLHITGLSDAALLLESLRDTIRELFSRGDEWREDIINATAYPLFLVPRYCHWVIEQGERQGPILLDAINHLRQYGGEKVLVESQLLNIDIDPTLTPLKALKSPPSSNVKGVLAHVIPLFKKARLALDKQPVAALNLLDKVCVHLQKACGNAPIAELFWLLAALIEAMRDGDLRLTKQRKQWLLLVEKHLINLYQHTESALAKPPSLAMKREFLALLALSCSTSSKSQKLMTLYKLPKPNFCDRDIALGMEKIRQPGSDTFHALVKDINGAINRIHDVLMPVLSQTEPAPDAKEQVIEQFGLINAAITMCDLPHTHSLIDQCRQHLDALCADYANRDALEGLAKCLLAIPERFNVMGDQSLNAKQKNYWSNVDDLALMPERIYKESQSVIIEHCLKSVGDTILQLDIAYETESYDNLESLLAPMRQVHASLTLVGESTFADQCLDVLNHLESCSILAERKDIEALSWPLMTLHEGLFSYSFSMPRRTGNVAQAI